MSYPVLILGSDNSFFTDAVRIGEQGYIPTETDVLRARQKSTGITETRFNMGQLSSVSSSSLFSFFWLTLPLEYTCSTSAGSGQNGRSGFTALNPSPVSSSVRLFQNMTRSYWRNAIR